MNPWNERAEEQEHIFWRCSLERGNEFTVGTKSLPFISEFLIITISHMMDDKHSKLIEYIFA
jgi:hypothetical protein